MRITTDGYSLLKIQSRKGKEVKSIEEHYIRYCKNLYKQQSVFTRWAKRLKWYPSLRFFHVGEYFATGQSLEKLKEDREAWHDFWCLDNAMFDFSSIKPNTIVNLDSYESEVVLRLAKYLRIEINTYKS